MSKRVKLDQRKLRQFAEAVQPAYAAMNWTWGQSLTPPTVQDVVDVANELAKYLTDAHSGSAATFGLVLQRLSKDQLEGPGLELRFEYTVTFPDASQRS